MTTEPAPTSTERTPSEGPPPPDPHRSAAGGWPARLRDRLLRGLTTARSRIAFWSRSLLVRVVVLTLSLSAVVMITLGLVLQQQITAGLLQSKIDAAAIEIENARQTVQNSLSGADSDPNSLREQLQLALT
ncbi:MAG TPA: two-component sensor histidine kinase, partial [Nakamurella sp.]